MMWSLLTENRQRRRRKTQASCLSFLLQFLLLVVNVAIPNVGIITLNIHIALAFDASLFSANRVRNPLGILDLPLAEGNLFSHYRLLINRYLLLTNRNPVGFAFTYWRIG